MKRLSILPIMISMIGCHAAGEIPRSTECAIRHMKAHKNMFDIEQMNIMQRRVSDIDRVYFMLPSGIIGGEAIVNVDPKTCSIVNFVGMQ